MRIESYLLRAAVKHPDRVAVVTDDALITYGELKHAAAGWADRLRASGVLSSSRVIVSLEPAGEFLAAMFGVWMAGATAIPFDARRPARELENVIESYSAGLIAGPALQVTTTRAIEASSAASTAADEPAVIFLTSGTTGQSKGVLYSHRQLAANVSAVVEASNWTADDRCLTPVHPVLPAALMTCVIPAFQVGGSVRMTNAGLPRKIFESIGRSGASILFAVPYTYELMVDSLAGAALRSQRQLRLCMTSSAPMRDKTARVFHEQTGKLIRSIYCSSEAGNCALNDAEDIDLSAESVGRALPGVLIDILGEDGRTLPRGEIGRVAVSGALVATGYAGSTSGSAEPAFDGRVVTQDLGLLAEDGYLYLRGRSTDRINCAGFEIDPTEVEEILLSHPAVREAKVYGEAHPTLNMQVVVDVALSETTSAKDITDYCLAQLAPYKVPRRINFVDSLSRTALGKIRRHDPGQS